MAELNTVETATNLCCAPEARATCCEPSAKPDCCGASHGGSCGCAAAESTASATSGAVAVLYPPTSDPAWFVHDVPLPAAY